MGWYRVCLNTIVRKDVKLDSERLRILPMGSRVNVVKQNGRRVMIDQPIQGWCSLASSNGDTILKPLSDDTSTQTPRSDPQAQAAHYKQEAAKARSEAEAAAEAEEKSKLLKKSEQYDALAKQVVAQKKAHEQELAALSKAATSTNVETMVFRDGDVIKLAMKNHNKSLVIVRTVITVADQEWIGVDCSGDSSPHRPAEGGTHPQDPEQKVHFESNQGMKGGWVLREEVEGYISGGSIVPQLDQIVLKHQLVTSTLQALQSIINELSQEKQWAGLNQVIAQKAKQYETQE